MEKKSRRNYTLEFKQQAIALAEELKSIAKAEGELGIPHGLIHQWRKKFGAKPSGPTVRAGSLDEENRRLRQENEKLKKVNHILKSAAAFFSQDHLK